MRFVFYKTYCGSSMKKGDRQKNRQEDELENSCSLTLGGETQCDL